MTGPNTAIVRRGLYYGTMFYQPRHAKPSATRQRVLTAAAAGATTGALVYLPATASAAPALPPAPAIPGSSLPDTQELSSQVQRDALGVRDQVVGQLGGLPPQLADPAREAVDGSVEALFPGALAQREEQRRPAPAPQPAPAPAPAPAPRVDTGPCPREADACVDLAGGRTWLQDGGEVSYGPVPMSAGAPSPETATPRGTFYVNRKVEHDVSKEHDDAAMPYSVYFTNNGHAFHEGNTNLLSHGCIHLRHDDAVVYFDRLQAGDMVYVY